MIVKLETALSHVPGVGMARRDQLTKLKLLTVSDLLVYRPRRFEDRRHPQFIRDAVEGRETLVRGRITAHGINRFRRNQKSVYECVVEDGTGRLHCRYWNMPYLESQLAVGQQLFIFGKISRLRPTTMDHPEFEMVHDSEDAQIHLNRIVPVYRLTEGLTQRWLRGLVWRLLEQVEVPETKDEHLASAVSKSSRLDQLKSLHFPATLEEQESARLRFALEELIALQRGFARRRQALQARAQSAPCQGDNRLIRPFLRALHFRLTNAQTKVLREIRADLGCPHPMRRLLHGDVGSGKTVVAACAALMAIESGYHVALMAPTEILAGQHYRRLSEWFTPLGITVALHTGKAKIKPGAATADLTVGTHALIHDGFQPERLGLVIIDEQHRFGVVQRDRLLKKGFYPHLLVMTATPLPRTLGLTVYGDLDLSALDELPARRGRVRTYLRTTVELPNIWRFVSEQLDAGRQAYFVYPRIDETGSAADLKSVLEEHDRLREKLAPHAVGLLHGRMNASQSEAVMLDFLKGKLAALVATTVIEVGLDVPNATVMVVENAGQYGLSQLHQLRGRIGRGTANAHCILVEDGRQTDKLARLGVMLRTTNGFEIAEEDLRLRGMGDFLGTRQSGLPQLKFADFSRDQKIVEASRKIVQDHPV